MSLDGIWLASASERRSVLLKDFITKKNSGIKLVCEPLIEDEISPKKPSLKETVYSITKMNMWALIIILVSVCLFSGYAHFTLPSECEVKISEFYMKVYDLPPKYPLPLDIKDAIQNCEVAKRVFKTHEI